MTESGAAGLGGVADGRGGTGWMNVAVKAARSGQLHDAGSV